MSKENKKDFNAIIKDMSKYVKITYKSSIERYSWDNMYFTPLMVYDEVMRS